MHEMSLCESILDILETEARNQSFNRVTKVLLEIGELAAVEIEAMHFCYDMVVKDTVADKSELVIREIPAIAKCRQCHEQMTVKTRYEACVACGSYELDVIMGDQMKIKELEVE